MQQMSPAPAPLHLLLLGKTLADHGVHVASTKAEEIRSLDR
jgi:hypothetical protein